MFSGLFYIAASIIVFTAFIYIDYKITEIKK
jgi:hypothetical protein